MDVSEKAWDFSWGVERTLRAEDLLLGVGSNPLAERGCHRPIPMYFTSAYHQAAIPKSTVRLQPGPAEPVRNGSLPGKTKPK